MVNEPIDVADVIIFVVFVWNPHIRVIKDLSFEYGLTNPSDAELFQELNNFFKVSPFIREHLDWHLFRETACGRPGPAATVIAVCATH